MFGTTSETTEFTAEASDEVAAWLDACDQREAIEGLPADPPEHPSNAVRRASTSERSANTMSFCGMPAARARSADRTTQRCGRFSSLSRRAMTLPRKPLAPVIAITATLSFVKSLYDTVRFCYTVNWSVSLRITVAFALFLSLNSLTCPS